MKAPAGWTPPEGATVKGVNLDGLSGSQLESLPIDISEADFQAKVIAKAKGNGWEYYHTHDSRRSPEGFPDLVLVRGQSLMFVELKKEKGTVSPEQEKWLKLLAATGAIACVWRPSHWPLICKILEGGT